MDTILCSIRYDTADDVVYLFPKSIFDRFFELKYSIGEEVYVDNLVEFTNKCSGCTGFQTVIADLVRTHGHAKGANFVMKFVNKNSRTLGGLNQIINDGAKFEADVLLNNIYHELKSWSGNLMSLQGFKNQMKNYLSKIDDESMYVGKFKYVFDADGFVPDAQTFKNHLLANKNFYFDNFDINTPSLAQYKAKYELSKIDSIEDLIDQLVSKHYSTIITKL